MRYILPESKDTNSKKYWIDTKTKTTLVFKLIAIHSNTESLLDFQT